MNIQELRKVVREQLMMEGLFSNIMKSVKNSSGPWAIIVVKNSHRDGRPTLAVVEQDFNIKTAELLPASYQVMKKKYPGEKIYIEDATGSVIWKDW